jgi:hypothetical protein
MNRRTFLCGLTFRAAAAAFTAEAQSAGQVYRVGFLRGNVASHHQFQAEAWQPFVHVFRSARLVEGRHVIFERRFAKRDVEQISMLAPELAGQRMDVIMTARIGVGFSGLPPPTVWSS